MLAFVRFECLEIFLKFRTAVLLLRGISFQLEQSLLLSFLAEFLYSAARISPELSAISNGLQIKA